ncbi:type II toxin-antitoxin system Phd/YefM family antitoxin [Glaciimonas sp. GG7]
MHKEVQMSIKMEQELRDQFMAAAAAMHRPAAQIVRDLMRSYIARQEQPNAETIAAIEAAERGEVNRHDANSLMETLHLLSSPANAAHLARSIAELHAGQVVSNAPIAPEDTGTDA